MSNLADLRATVDWYDEKISKEEDDTRKDELKAERQIAVTNLQNAMESMSKMEIKPTIVSSTNQQRYANVKQIETALNDIPRFDGNNPAETETFLDRLSQAHKILVTDVDTDLEGQFVKSAKLRLGPSVYKHLMNAGETIATMEEMTKFIRTHYSAKINAIQSFSKIFDIEFEPRLPYCTYATEITNVIKVAFRQLLKQYKEMNKESNDDMPAEVMSQFLGAFMTANHIRNHNPETYRDMIRELDTCLTAQRVANTATFYRHRLQQESTTTAFFGRQNAKSSNERQAKNNGQFNGQKSRNGDKVDGNNRRNERSDDRNSNNDQRNNGQRNNGQGRSGYKGKNYDPNYKKNRRENTGNQNESKSTERRENVTSGATGSSQPVGQRKTYVAEPTSHYGPASESVFQSSHFH